MGLIGEGMGATHCDIWRYLGDINIFVFHPADRFFDIF